jgi:hypothetical protein
MEAGAACVEACTGNGPVGRSDSSSDGGLIGALVGAGLAA